MSAELVIMNGATLDQLPRAQREVAVTRYLSDARDRLALAVEATGPEQVARMKAEIATVAEATKQLGLSKEIRDDAIEMVRRAEYSLGKSIRNGQEDGTIRRSGDDCRTDLVDRNNYIPKPSPYDFASKGEMHANGAGIADLVDGVSEDHFEEALAEARQEGNLTRKNVVRKIRSKQSEAGKQSEPDGEDRLDKITELANRGMTSRQIGDQLGCSHEYVRQLARDAGIDIPADRTMGRASQRIDHTKLVQQTVTTLESLVVSLRLLNIDQVDPTQADEWSTSLTDSLRALNRFRKQIKEIDHV